MSEHTPGPWRVGYDGPSRPIILTGDHGMLSVSRFINGRWESYNKEDSDARLIAAAPDLLEAARHAAMEWRLHGQLTDSCRVLEAAIAKAEGR